MRAAPGTKSLTEVRRTTDGVSSLKLKSKNRLYLDWGHQVWSVL